MCFDLSRLVSKMTHEVVEDMYTERINENENGKMIFKQKGIILFIGIVLICMFSASCMVMDSCVLKFVDDFRVDDNMIDVVYACGYTLSVLFILLGIRLVINFFKRKIIISNDLIILEGIFSKKTMKLHEIKKITFSNFKGLIFNSSDCKIPFGNFTVGLIQVLKFIQDNIPQDKYGTTIVKAKKMLKNNRVSTEGI